MKSFPYNNRGVAIVIALGMVAMFALLAAEVGTVVISSMKQSADLENSIKAYYVAESGLNKGLFKLTHPLEDVNLEDDNCVAGAADCDGAAYFRTTIIGNNDIGRAYGAGSVYSGKFSYPLPGTGDAGETCDVYRPVLEVGDRDGAVPGDDVCNNLQNGQVDDDVADEWLRLKCDLMVKLRGSGGIGMDGGSGRSQAAAFFVDVAFAALDQARNVFGGGNENVPAKGQEQEGGGGKVIEGQNPDVQGHLFDENERERQRVLEIEAEKAEIREQEAAAAALQQAALQQAAQQRRAAEEAAVDGAGGAGAGDLDAEFVAVNNVLETYDPADLPCNWNKLKFGETVQIPLHGGQDDKELDFTDFKLRVRTPCIAQDDGLIPEFCENRGRHELVSEELDEGGPARGLIKNILVLWSIENAECGGVSCFLSMILDNMMDIENVEAILFPSLITSALVNTQNSFEYVALGERSKGALNADERQIFGIYFNDGSYESFLDFANLADAYLKLSYIKRATPNNGAVPYLEYQFLYSTEEDKQISTQDPLVISEGFSGGFKKTLKARYNPSTGVINYVVQQ